MGKFDGVLLMSDYDDTLYSHKLEVSKNNRMAIRYFMEQGGRFSIATGRAHTTFTPQIEKERIPFNAPVVLSNGAAIYDYQAERYLVQSRLDDTTPLRMKELCTVFPELAFEAYHGEDIYIHNPNEATMRHIRRVQVPYTVCPIDEMPTPWVKVIMEQEEPCLRRAQDYVLSRWGEHYEVIFSNPVLLEMTDKGCHKGAMVVRVAEHLGIAPDRVYCIGDNQNDIPMLAVSAIPFAPANCAPEVRAWGARIVRHCDDDALADVVDILDGIY